MSAAEQVIVVDADPDERMEVHCRPFEPQFSGYGGEMLLSLRYRGKEESFVVLSPTQAQRLAQSLVGQKVTETAMPVNSRDRLAYALESLRLSELALARAINRSNAPAATALTTVGQEPTVDHDDAASPAELPLVECMPWCDRGDGHPGCWCEADQSCWEPIDYVTLSLEPSTVDEMPTVDGRGSSESYPQQLGVLARRRPNQAGHVLIHLDGMQLGGPIPDLYKVLDHEVILTPDEAEQMGHRLIASAQKAREATATRG